MARVTAGAPKRLKGATALLWSSAVAFALVVGLLAGRATVAPPRAPAPDPTPASYTVGEGSVGRSLRFPATAEWPGVDLPAGLAEGVLTSVDVTHGELVGSGTVLYTVDLRPVVLVEGEIPVFRDLVIGSQGPDVAQLRAHLQSGGHLRSTRSSTTFDAITELAVKRWQRSLGVDPDGRVRAGDVIFSPGLPVRVSTGSASPGDLTEPGVAVVGATASVPSFTVTLAADQAAVVPTEGPVTVSGAGHAWAGLIGSAQQLESTLVLTLTGADGGPVCGAECDAMTPPASGGASVFQADITIVPETVGPVVPVAAIGRTGAGDHVVTLTAGRQVRVRVLASADGMAVVEGLQVGDEVLLVADHVHDAEPVGGA